MPLPNSNIEVGSGTVGVGVGEKQLTQNGVIATLGEGVAKQSGQNGVIWTLGLGVGVTQSVHTWSWCVQTPVTQTSGINARKGHQGSPPAAGISPQSQMVPSTESWVNTCTLLCGCCAVTSIPEVKFPVRTGSVTIAGTVPPDGVEGFWVPVVGSCNAARSLSCCSWPPFCKSPITLMTSP